MSYVNDRNIRRDKDFNVTQTIDTLLVLFNSGRHAEAEELARKTVGQNPSLGLAWKVLAAALAVQGRITESIVPMQNAVALLPLDAETHRNLGNALRDLGRFHEAEASYRRALEIDPEYAEAHYNLGNALHALGRLSEAEESYRGALKINGGFAEAHYNLGNALAALGRLAEAEESYRKALEINPGYAAAYNNLGNTLHALGRLAEAEESYRRALEIKPQYAEAHNNLGNTLSDFGRLVEAEDSYRKAIEIDGEYAEAHYNLGNNLNNLARLAEAEASYRRALEIRPEFVEAHSNLLFSMSYDPRRNSVYYRGEGSRYGEVVAHNVERFSDWHCAAPPTRLRVGLVSGDLRQHPVGFFLEGILSKIDHSCIELIAYPTWEKVTDLTSRLKAYCSAWKPLVGLNDQAAARLIHSDGVHVLIDLSGHTAHNRLPVFAWKPAPVQVTWLGFWAGTGVKEIDYILVDKEGVPPGKEGEFTEQPWYLPGTRMCFTPPESAPAVAPLPALNNPGRQVTFGCFQALSKVSPETMSLWERVLAALPDATLRWQCKQFDDPTCRLVIMERLSCLGLDRSRVHLKGSVSRPAYLAAYAEVDAVLDTFPFPGGTTTCEALWMGVPTLTLAGESMLARQGAGLLSAAGLPEWIAESEDDFLNKAVNLFGGEQALCNLAELRRRLREQVRYSLLFDAERFARNWEEALWGMWNRRQVADSPQIPAPTSP